MKKKLVTLTLLLFLGANYFSINYYVDGIFGNNASSGLTLAFAKKTIQAASNITAPGDTVFIANGTYTSSGSSIINVAVAGNATNYITYINYPNHYPKIKLSANNWNGFFIGASINYIRIIGLEVEGLNQTITLSSALNQPGGCINTMGPSQPLYNGNGISVDARNAGTVTANHSHHIEIKNNIVHDCAGGGISAIQADYITIMDNTVYNNSWYTIYGASGISLLVSWNSDNSTAYKNFIIRNKCFSNRLYVPWVGGPCAITDGNGIIIDSNKNQNMDNSGLPYNGATLIQNNICWFNGGSGIHSFQSSNVDIINNTAFRNSQSISINGGQIFPSYSTNVKIYNNILVSDSANKVNTNSSCTLITYSNNLHYNLTPAQTVTAALTNTSCVINLDPLFVNPTYSLNANFHLLNASPAINAGNTSTFTATDYDGLIRPQGIRADIGAYEYAMPVANFTTTSAVCVGSPVLLSNTSSTNAVAYLWNMPNAVVPTSTLQNTSASYTAPGIKSITLTISNGAGSSSITKTITVNPTPTVNITTSNSLICVGQSATLTANTAANSFSWTTGGVLQSILVSPTVTTNYSVTVSYSTGCSSITSFTQNISVCSGINLTTSSNSNIDFTLYPNPNNGKFVIFSQLNQTYSITIFNTVGQTIRTIKSNQNEFEIDLSSFAKGIYNVSISSNGAILNKKIIVN